MKQEIVNCLTWLLNALSQAHEYKSLSAESKQSILDDGFKTFYKEIAKYIDFKTLTLEGAKELRFGKWDDESDLMLFPLWLKPIIPKGLMVTSISGNTEPYNKNMDSDTRFGYLAYGLEIKAEEPKT